MPGDEEEEEVVTIEGGVLGYRKNDVFTSCTNFGIQIKHFILDPGIGRAII